MRALAWMVVLAACSRSPDHPPAQIIELTGSPAALYTDFDAHKNEPRFVTLVAPS